MARSFYMDNLVTSLSSQEEVQQSQNTAVNIMEMAKMDFLEWEFNLSVSNSKEERGTTTKVLGLVWDKVQDVLNCDFSIEKDLPRRLTKRIVLSKIQQVSDPLGVFSPIFLPPKLLLQRSWELIIGWDSQLPEDMDREFRTWYSQIRILNEIKIPRHIRFDQTTKNEIHVFCDASKSAYAAVAYMRSEVQAGVYLSLRWSKSRLAPTKRVTIPRLELLACVLGARLVKFILTALTNSCPVTLWTDSSTVMAWLKRKNEWNVFVRNRVQEIRDTVNNENWKFVYGKLNPADLPSRGCSITNANNEFPELEKIRVNSFTRKYKVLSKLNEELKQRFGKNLGVLMQRAENKRERCLKEEDLVLIGQDNTKRIIWPVGKIVKLYLGKDGVNRVARVKTSTGEWLRPVHRLFPLESTSEETPEKACGDKKKTLTIKKRSGREVRKPI
ncbi:hypothetical protein LAZ67_4002499, partial [Cordylochernes scorpioides]